MKWSTLKPRLRKFFIRWMVVNVVFLLVKASVPHDEGDFYSFFSGTAIFYYCSSFILFMVSWEWNDHLIKRSIAKDGLSVRNSFIIYGKTLLFLMPLAFMIYYLGLFPLKETFGVVCTEPVAEFKMNMLNALILCTAVVFSNLFYHSNKQRETLSQQIADLQKNMLASQYASLKNQISPHFLFNSLNTLTALMYEDRDLASDFVTRLASSYRYILDHREEDLVPLHKELAFMDSFVFMMNVRHKNAVNIQVEVAPETHQLLIPTLSLQMLVENALKHNRHSPEQPLTITLKNIGTEALTVKNNLQKRQLQEPTTGVGLDNIKERFAFYTNKTVLVQEEADYFEVIIPLLTRATLTKKLQIVS